MDGNAIVLQGNALSLPLPDASVDLIVTSPPYWGLRSYRDDGTHYLGQIGSEATPEEFLRALWWAADEMRRVLKPSGSLFVNLGDKYAGSGGHNNANIIAGGGGGNSRGPGHYPQGTDWAQPKSLMGLPWAFALGMVNPGIYRAPLDPGAHPHWLLRAEIVWSKPNGLPESVTDRVRRSHEQWFHFTRQGRYFSAVDEVREAQKHPNGTQGPGFSLRSRDAAGQGRALRYQYDAPNPLGKLPGSVWSIPSEPLLIPEEVQRRLDLPDHFAAFPTEWPRRLILGWSPSGICMACGEGRRPVVAREFHGSHNTKEGRAQRLRSALNGGTGKVTLGRTDDVERSITGYACACPEPTAPTRPAVVLDPFGGTGTVAMVARALGRIGLSVDLSHDYSRLARWRVFQSGHQAKATARFWGERQEALL